MDQANTPLFGGRTFFALLFDMDGTVLNSMGAVDRVWGRWALEHGLDPQALIPTLHGVRAADTILKLKLPGVDADLEAEKIAAAEIADIDGVVAIKGARKFLTSLPPDRWAIVTSAPLKLAERRMEAAGLPPPLTLISAEDVTAGKPSPEGYRRAASRMMSAAASDCLVFEDAAAGVQAAEAAGSTVLVITAAHSARLETSHPAIADYSGIRACVGPDGRISLVRTAMLEPA